MNKFLPLIFLFGFAYCGQKQESDLVSVAADTVGIDTTIYDSKPTPTELFRSSGDGYFDFVILGDGYKGKDGLTLFLQDKDSAIAAILGTAPFNLFKDKIRFYIRNSKQSLGCDDNTGINEGMLCNTDKIIAAVKDIQSNLFQTDRVLVLANGKGHGGSDGAMIAIDGVGNHSRSIYCTFYQAAFWGKEMHELGHTFLGAGHLEGTKMGSCTNGCCEIWNKPFNSDQQTTISKVISSVLNQTTIL